MLDELVETMENDPSLGVFHLDGQTIVMEDYAEINPEGAKRLKKLVAQGRVKIGPWYVMQNAYLWKDQRPYPEPEKDEKTDCILTVYNPLPTLRDEVVEASVEMRTDYPYQYAEPFGYEMINSFRLLDENGAEIPYQIVKIRKNQIVPIVDQHDRGADVYTIAFRAQLPAGGKVEYRIVPSEKPVRYLRHMISGQDFMENGYVKIRIVPNGSITLEDKETGKTYENQLNLADDIEIGDGWFHAPAVENRICYSYGTDAQIEKDAVVVRVWNASGTETTAKIAFAKEMKDAKRVNLNEETEEGALHRDGNSVTLPLTPWKIASVMVKL